MHELNFKVCKSEEDVAHFNKNEILNKAFNIAYPTRCGTMQCVTSSRGPSLRQRVITAFFEKMLQQWLAVASGVARGLRMGASSTDNSMLFLSNKDQKHW